MRPKIESEPVSVVAEEVGTKTFQAGEEESEAFLDAFLKMAKAGMPKPERVGGQTYSSPFPSLVIPTPIYVNSDSPSSNEFPNPDTLNPKAKAFVPKSPKISRKILTHC
ncbi:MAG: hypothetical protein KGP29_05555 [Proteobacteria bacterium]|nr:hypothetical protein [Pseudomonadota bacterium]